MNRTDASGQPLLPGDFCVGDSGKAYILLPEQYGGDQSDFIRVAYVTIRNENICWNPGDVHGQHANCVVRISKHELFRWTSKEVLIKYYNEKYISKKEEYVARKLRVKRGY